MITLVCVRNQKGASEADRRKGLDYVEIGRREFETKEAAMEWLYLKEKTLKAKGVFAMVRKEGDCVDLLVVHDNSTTDFYKFV